MNVNIARNAVNRNRKHMDLRLGRVKAKLHSFRLLRLFVFTLFCEFCFSYAKRIRTKATASNRCSSWHYNFTLHQTRPASEARCKTDGYSGLPKLPDAGKSITLFMSFVTVEWCTRKHVMSRLWCSYQSLWSRGDNSKPPSCRRLGTHFFPVRTRRTFEKICPPTGRWSASIGTNEQS